MWVYTCLLYVAGYKCKDLYVVRISVDMYMCVWGVNDAICVIHVCKYKLRVKDMHLK